MDGETGASREGLFPVPSAWFELAFYLFLFAWLAYIVYEAAGWDSFEDYFFVYLLAPLIFVLLLYRSVAVLAPDRIRIVDEVFGKDGVGEVGDAGDTGDAGDVEPEAESEVDAETDSIGRESKAEEEKYAIYMVLWTAALPVAMFFFGMAWVLPVYIFAFTWFFTGNPKRAALVTVFAVGFIYFVFIEILNVLLWTGYLGLPNPVNYLP